MCVLRRCPPVRLLSLMRHLTMAAASSSCASAGPSEPTAPTQAQHVARWNDEAEIPTWARLRGLSDSHSVRKHLLCV